MRKKYILLMLLMLSIATVGAKAENVSRLVIELNSGSVTEFLLEDSPVATCAGGTLRVEGGGQVVEAALSDVKEYRFAIGATGVGEVGNGRFGYESGHVYISNARSGEAIRVFNFQGQQVAGAKADAAGSAAIDLNQLGAGAYIVKSSTASIKIIKK